MKVLFLSDSPFTNTGFSTISMNILNCLAEKGHECIFMAHNYFGQDLPKGIKLKDGTEFKFEITGAGRMQYCQDLIVPKIREFKADIFGCLLDTFMVSPFYPQLDMAPARTVFYFPSDGGGGLPVGGDMVLRKCNMPVAMSRFAQKQALEVHKIKTEYIPHAVNEEIFYPLSIEKKEENRTKWMLKNKFIVGTVTRNQPRKMLDRMIKSFAIFCRDKPDAVLLMHLDPTDPAAPFDIQKLIVDQKIQNRCLFTNMRYFRGFTYQQMNEVFNLMDVFLLTTSGEGFGVPIIEAMACEIPCAVTDYTTTNELLKEDGECGIPIKLSCEVTGNMNVERGISDDYATLEALNILYEDKELRERYGKTGREKVLKYYTWKVVGESWDKLLRGLHGTP